MNNGFDVVVVGTGFASTFFLHEWLKHAPANQRIAVLEGGRLVTHAEQLAQKRNGGGFLSDRAQGLYRNQGAGKHIWTFTRDFGGGSNCWWGETPRQLPEDFKINSLYGVGVDWPFSYDELETFYTDAEEMMQIAGPNDVKLWPMSKPYPQPPHAMMATDHILKKAYPDTFIAAPAARPSRAVGNRPACCNSQYCHLCPANSKFTIVSELLPMYRDPRITLVTDAVVKSVETGANRIVSARYVHDGQEKQIRGELFVLGANGMFNAHILLRSGITHPELGRGLNEQPSRNVIIDIHGIKNFQGGTVNTAIGYMSHNGPHRRRYAAVRFIVHNLREYMRADRGRWRERLLLTAVWEDLRVSENQVIYDPADPDRPLARFGEHSKYAQAGIANLQESLKPVLDMLPVEKVTYAPIDTTIGYINGTHVMGDDPTTSITDGFSVSHQYRNLLLLGGGGFPTTPTSNPALTVSAMALRTARALASSEHIN